VEVGPGDILSQQQFILGCAAYRQKVIHDLEEVLTEFVNLSNAMAQVSANPQAHSAVKEMVFKSSMMDNHDMTVLYDGARSFGLLDSIERSAYKNWLGENEYPIMEFQFLISNGIIEVERPYILGNLKDLWREFQFYNVKANMTIADIGAGNGVITFIMLESGLPLNLVMTEIDEDFLTILKTKIVKYSSRNELSSISLIRGTDKDLGFYELNVDRILLREVYHHLVDPQSILKDISLHLKPGGYLILKESTKELNRKSKTRCYKATTYKKIIKEFSASGYDLVALEIIGDSYMLKFKQAG
jgi:ubiquinone/menaquinone biosynthesis C-methylase UbiE